MQIFTVIPELLVISCHKVDAVWRGQFSQWLGCSRRIDGCAVIQVSRDKNRVWVLLQNLCHHPTKKTAVSHVPQVYIADQRGFSPAPGCRQVREPHGGSRNPRPTRVEYPVESSENGKPKQQLHAPMKVHVQPGQPGNPENNPGGNRREKEEAHQTYPNCSNLVKRPQRSVRVAKGEQRSGDKAHRQRPEDEFDPERAVGFAPCGRKGPGLIEEIMGQQKNRLNSCDDTD